MSSDEKMKK
jgi:Ca2+-binding EF-hand superfamily protein